MKSDFDNNYWKRLLADSRPKLIILVYHRVLPKITFDSLQFSVYLKTFVKQIKTLTKRYPILALNDIINNRRSVKQKSKVQIVLTFDDGYWDNYEIAFPILKKYGLPATFFLATDYVNNDKPLWDFEVTNLLNEFPTLKSIKIKNRVICQKNKEIRPSFIFRILDAMNFLDIETRQKTINLLKSKLRKKNKLNTSKGRCITWVQARTMSQNGMEIGAHGIYHRALSRIPFNEAIHEINGSKEAIENNTKKPCIHFALPFGNEYDRKLVDYLKIKGFHTCLNTIQGYNHIPGNKFFLKRIIMTESTPLGFFNLFD